MAHTHLDWNGWGRGLWVSVVSAVSDGVVVAMGLNFVDPKHWNIHENSLWNLLSPVCLLLGTKAFFLYLSQHPAPTQITVESQKTTTMPSGKTIAESTKTTATVPTEAPTEK